MIDGPTLVEPHGVEIFRHTVLIVGDDGVGHIEDIRCRAVIARQSDIGLRLEVYEDLGVGTAPFVDRLVGIAHDEEIAVVGGEDMEVFPVVGRAVLHLVDHNIVELVGPVAVGLLEMIEDIDGEIYQVVIVEGILLELQSQIAGKRVRAFRG